MGCMRPWGISVLFAGLAVGCAAGAEDPIATVKAGEDTGVPGDETAAPVDDSAPAADTAPALEYPPGPYGKAVGNVLPNLTWDGYRDGTGEWTKLSLLDYYDPDGSRKINAIKIGAAALW